MRDNLGHASSAQRQAISQAVEVTIQDSSSFVEPTDAYVEAALEVAAGVAVDVENNLCSGSSTDPGESTSQSGASVPALRRWSVDEALTIWMNAVSQSLR